MVNKKKETTKSKTRITRQIKKSCDVVTPKVYTSLLPQIIDSVGNFINNSKNPWLIVALLIILSGVFIIHELITIENNYVQQNEIIKKTRKEEEDLKEKEKNSFKNIPLYWQH